MHVFQLYIWRDCVRTKKKNNTWNMCIKLIYLKEIWNYAEESADTNLTIYKLLNLMITLVIDNSFECI